MNIFGSKVNDLGKPALSDFEILEMLKTFDAVILQITPRSKKDPNSLIFIYTLGDNQELKDNLGYLGEDTHTMITHKYGVKVFYFCMEYEKVMQLLKVAGHTLDHEEVKI